MLPRPGSAFPSDILAESTLPGAKATPTEAARAAFGDDDDTFYSSLRRYEEEAEEGELDKMMEDIKRTEGSAEWFIGELWEHLGWDILSGRRGP